MEDYTKNRFNHQSLDHRSLLKYRLEPNSIPIIISNLTFKNHTVDVSSYVPLKHFVKALVL